MPSEMIGWEHVHQRQLHAPRLSDNDDSSCWSPPPPPPPPPLPAYDVAQLQAGEAVGPEGVDANKFDFLAKGVLPCVFFSALFWAKSRGKKSEMNSLSEKARIFMDYIATIVLK